MHSPYPDALDTIKAVMLGVMDNSKLSDIRFGTVVSESPLKIKIDNSVELDVDCLDLTNAVKDHNVDITVSWETVENTHKHENGNEGKPTDEHTHKHAIRGRKRITIHNGLTIGERVLLLRKQGGQKYIVLDRVTAHTTTGENL